MAGHPAITRDRSVGWTQAMPRRSRIDDDCALALEIDLEGPAERKPAAREQPT